MVKKYFPFLLLLFSSCFLFEDKDNQNTNLTLSLHSAGVTTVNLNISPEDSLAEFTFELTRDDSTIQTISLQSDTPIKDTRLNPNTSYSYKGYWLNGTERIGESETLTVTTMDTTSHNFTWEIDTLGNGGELNDVWIVDEDDIWVVGNIITDSMEYNAAHWNGNQWEMMKIHSGAELNAIQYFSDDDIWVSSGFPKHWDGNEWTMYHLQNMGFEGVSINTLWGTSSNNMYFVGYRGSIIHYDGNEFVKMESPTTQNLDGIIGVVDPETGQKHIWAYGWPDAPYHGLFLQSDGIYWDIIWDENNPFFEDEQFVTPTAWVNGDNLVLYTGGSDHGQVSIHDIHDLTNYEIIYFNYNGAIRKIRGNNINDFFGVGDFGNVFHFNGITFKHFDSLSNTTRYSSVNIFNDLVIICNQYSSIIIWGNRTH